MPDNDPDNDPNGAPEGGSPDITFILKYCRFDVSVSARIVATTFPDGRVSIATRDDNAQNRREAEAQGYTGPLAVWRSLVEHELLHSLVAEILFDRPSLVLTTESGGEFTPTWLRYEEEMLALSTQAWLHDSLYLDKDLPLFRYSSAHKLLSVWRALYKPGLDIIFRRENTKGQ